MRRKQVFQVIARMLGSGKLPMTSVNNTAAFADPEGFSDKWADERVSKAVREGSKMLEDESGIFRYALKMACKAMIGKCQANKSKK